MSTKFFDTGKPIKFTTGATKTFWNPSVGFKSEKDSGSDMDYAFWDELKDFYSKETTEGSESEIASILATRLEVSLIYYMTPNCPKAKKQHSSRIICKGLDLVQTLFRN